MTISEGLTHGPARPLSHPLPRPRTPPIAARHLLPRATAETQRQRPPTRSCHSPRPAVITNGQATPPRADSKWSTEVVAAVAVSHRLARRRPAGGKRELQYRPSTTLQPPVVSRVHHLRRRRGGPPPAGSTLAAARLPRRDGGTTTLDPPKVGATSAPTSTCAPTPRARRWYRCDEEGIDEGGGRTPHRRRRHRFCRCRRPCRGTVEHRPYPQRSQAAAWTASLCKQGPDFHNTI